MLLDFHYRLLQTKVKLLPILYHNYLIGKDVELLIREESFYANNFIDNPVFFILPVIEKIHDDKEVKQSQVPIFRLSENDFKEISTRFFEFVCKEELVRKISLRHRNKDVDLVNQIDQSRQFTQHQFEARNVFNNVPLEKVIAHFKQLCEKDRLVLTELQFNNFINRAFLGNTSIEKQSFDTSKVSKTKIIKLFHVFYQKCDIKWDYEKPNIHITKYVKLLTDNFSNWEYKSVSDNFSRTGNRTPYWDETLLK